MIPVQRMSVFLEAMLLLLPPEAGGRTSPVAPREGSWRPLARLGGHTSRATLFEGPASLAPGDAARVMIELESHAPRLDVDREFELLEDGQQVVAVVSVLRVCRQPTLV